MHKIICFLPQSKKIMFYGVLLVQALESSRLSAAGWVVDLHQ